MAKKPVTTRSGRFFRLAGMTASVAGQYAGQRARRIFRSEEDNEGARSESYTRMADQIVDTLAVLIGRPLTNASASDAEAAILGYGLALDLTLRDVQSRLKEKGQPWERAKAFDGACPLSPFVCIDRLRRDHLTFTLDINRERQQTGDTRDMLNPIVPLIAHISTQFTLMPGDVVLTGTPKGVGPLESGQILSLELEDALFVETTVL